MEANRSGRTRTLVVLLAILLLPALLASCSGDSGGDDDEPSASTDESGAEDTGSDIDPNGILRIGYDLAQPSKGALVWDPAVQKTQLTDSGIFAMVYGNLLRLTTRGELVPDLAESSEIVDATTIELTLRAGATFSDGTPFDAEAVKAGLERNLAEGDPAGFSESFFEAETVAAVDDTTVRISVPNGAAASWHDTYLGSWETSIIKPGTTDFSKPIGAGPMVIEEFVSEQRLVLARNPGYWDAENIKVGGVEITQVPTGSSETAGPSALQAGQVDFVSVPTTQITTLGDDFEVVLEVNPNSLGTFMLCKRDEPLSDPLVRRALNMAIDREAIIEAVFDGAYAPALGLWPEGHRFHDPEVEDAVAYDPEGARALLEEAGMADSVEFDLYTIGALNLPQAAEVMQQMFADVGVTMNIVTSANYVADFLVAKKAGAGLVPTMGANRQKLLQWTGESVGNTCIYEDPELLDLQAQLAAVSDASDEAVEIWHEIERKVVAEDTLSVFVFFSAVPFAYNTEVVGDGAVSADFLAVPDIRTTYVKA